MDRYRQLQWQRAGARGGTLSAGWTLMAAVVILAICLALVWSGGCASAPRSRAVQVAQSVNVAVGTLQDQERTLFQAGALTPVAHKAFLEHLGPVIAAGKLFDAAIGASPGRPLTRGDVAALDDAITKLEAEVIAVLPPGQAQLVLQQYAAKVTHAALTVAGIFLQ